MTYNPLDYDIFIGMDVDKKSLSLTAQDNYIMNRAKRIPSNPENLYSYINKQFKGKRIICAYEAGPTGYYLHDYLKNKGIPCLVTSPSTIPKSPSERVKTNRKDSKKIVENLKGGQLKPIRVPYGAYRELRYLTKTRETYVRMRKATKQRIKALLLLAHLEQEIKVSDEKWTKRYINELKYLECNQTIRNRLDMLLADLDYLDHQIIRVCLQLKKFCLDKREIGRYVSYIKSAPGIGFVTAITFLARIGDPRRLKEMDEIGAFLGLVPSENSTGDDVNRGQITHLGNRELRRMLIECSWIAIQKDIQLRQFFERIKSRHHLSCASRKAITAVARKLVRIIYRLLKDERRYISYN